MVWIRDSYLKQNKFSERLQQFVLGQTTVNVSHSATEIYEQRIINLLSYPFFYFFLPFPELHDQYCVKK
jgi:hypothetical protein